MFFYVWKNRHVIKNIYTVLTINRIQEKKTWKSLAK